MKTNRRKGMRIVICMILCMIMFLSTGVNNALAEEDPYILEGNITNTNEEGIEDMAVRVTNLELEEYVTVPTDEDGYYSVDFTEEGWDSVSSEYIIETTNGDETGYVDTGTTGYFEEPDIDVGRSTGDIVVVDEEAIKMVFDDIYCGEVWVKYQTTSQSTKFVDSDETWVSTDGQGSIDVSFETHFDDLRTLAGEWEWKCFIRTEQKNTDPTNSKYTTYATGKYSNPEDVDHTPTHSFTVSGPSGNYYDMFSEAGYKIYRPAGPQAYKGSGIHTYIASK